MTDPRISREHLPAFIEGKTDAALRKIFPKTAKAHKTIKDRTKRKTSKTFLAPALQDFRAFLLELGPAPSPGHSVHRIDNNNPNYEPGNIVWATPKKQANARSSNAVLTWRGETRTLAEWADATRLDYEALKKRWQRGRKAGHYLDGEGDDELFAGSSVRKYKIVPKLRPRPEAPAAADPDHLVTPAPPAHGPYCAGIPILPEPPIGADGWPVGVTSSMWESSYQRFVAQRQKVDPDAHHFSKAHFFVWIAGRRLDELSRSIWARRGYIFHRDGIDLDRLADLWRQAADDLEVQAYFKFGPPLAAAMRVYAQENPADARSNFASLRALRKSKPCNDPHRAVDYLPSYADD
ncbi:hypothetical protein [Rhizobium lusitanum]|uniref:hypothetical protein n=1 Tax=Rhizobium lusitanum TaxID=293958 RepID=UPI0019590475|nr:hypothetical protein [Rhizobium lusitanum]MBM7048357.1 hypothetical protein [Rhizobium lusitanum]